MNQSQEIYSCVYVFTDGSVYNATCASVLFPLLESEEVIIETSVVVRKVSSYEYQVAGIVLAIKMTIQYLQHCTARKSVEEVYRVAQ